MGKIDFIQRVSEKANISNKDTALIINAAIDTIGDIMKKGDKLVIPGFGTFQVQKVKARKGRNIQTNEEIKIPAHKKVKFNPGKTLTECVYKKKTK
ncbi:HU family DNA-binding protein [bacterium]|nr:HU family DNA-binding protein [bacterium]